MRAKLLILFLGLLGLFVAVTAFRVDQLLFNDKLTWNEAQSRAQMGALSEALRADLNSARETLELAWPQVGPTKRDYPKGRPFSKFQMMGTLQRTAGDWNFDEKLYLEGSPVRSWASSYSVLALKALKDGQVPVNGSAVLALLDPSRKVYFLVLARTQTHWLAGVTGPEIFQRALDRQKGQVSSVFAVNSLGQTLAHTVPEYVGSLLNEDPVVKELLKSEAAAGAGTFAAPQGKVQGFYEQIPQTNVYVIVSTPVEELLASRKDVRWQVILLGVGFAMIGVAVLLLVLRNLSSAPTPAPGVPASVKKAIAAENSAASEARMQAYTKAASSLAHELRGPMLSLLGRARLMRENARDSGLQQDLSKIEEGAREAYGTLHKLLTFSGEKEEPLVEVALDDVLNRTLRLLAPRFKDKGIKLESRIPEVPVIRAQPSLLVKAFEQVLLNAVEAMERGLKKNLTVELSQTATGPRILIQDTGDGIQPKDLEHIFDPFFTTRAGSGHSGLGLSLALGIVRAAGGQMRARSDLGQGTSIEILFPLEANAVAQDRGLDAPAAGEASDSSDLPKPVRKDTTPSMQYLTPDKPADLPEVLNDRLMERAFDMIDHLDEVAEPFKAPPPAPPAPGPVAPNDARADEDRTVIVEASSEPPPPPAHAVGAKLDKPKTPPPKKKNRLLDLATEVRRPGGGGDRT